MVKYFIIVDDELILRIFKIHSKKNLFGAKNYYLTGVTLFAAASFRGSKLLCLHVIGPLSIGLLGTSHSPLIQALSQSKLIQLHFEESVRSTTAMSFQIWLNSSWCASFKSMTLLPSVLSCSASSANSFDCSSMIAFKFSGTTGWWTVFLPFLV